MFKAPERYRITEGPRASHSGYGNNGAFLIKSLKRGRAIFCICSDGMGWEHVSISIRLVGKGKTDIPTWNEMCYVKDMFWDEEDCVVQFHPPKSQYINTHPHVLHLWRSTEYTFPAPDKILV